MKFTGEFREPRRGEWYLTHNNTFVKYQPGLTMIEDPVYGFRRPIAEPDDITVTFTVAEAGALLGAESNERAFYSAMDKLEAADPSP